jgi:hypothetical protein
MTAWTGIFIITSREDSMQLEHATAISKLVSDEVFTACKELGGIGIVPRDPPDGFQLRFDMISGKVLPEEVRHSLSKAYKTVTGTNAEPAEGIDYVVREKGWLIAYSDEKPNKEAGGRGGR